MILRLQKQIKKMQKEMNALFKDAQNELTRESETSKHIIKSAAQRLAYLKKEKEAEKTAATQHTWVDVTETETQNKE